LNNQGGGNKKFEILVGIYLKDMDKFLVINKTEAFVTLASNPLSLNVLVNNAPTYVANIGETLNISVNYKNNYNVALNNLTLKVALSGDYFNFKRLIPNKGYFTYVNKTITYTENQIPELTTLNPGESGEITFSVPIKDSFEVAAVNDKNFVLNIKADMQSLTLPQELDPNSKIQASNSANIKLATDALLEVSGFFKDSKTTMTNCGSLPLKVGQKTCFTIHYKIKNYSNDINNVAVTTQLPTYVTYDNKYVTNYSNADLKFDNFSKKLT